MLQIIIKNSKRLCLKKLNTLKLNRNHLEEQTVQVLEELLNYNSNKNNLKINAQTITFLFPNPKSPKFQLNQIISKKTPLIIFKAHQRIAHSINNLRN